jgi:hypothetical protein
MREHIQIRGSSGITQPPWVLLLGETPQSTQKNKIQPFMSLRIRMLAPFLSDCFFVYIWKTIQNRAAYFLLFGKQPTWFHSFL